MPYDASISLQRPRWKRGNLPRFLGPSVTRLQNGDPQSLPLTAKL